MSIVDCAKQPDKNVHPCDWFAWAKGCGQLADDDIFQTGLMAAESALCGVGEVVTGGADVIAAGVSTEVSKVAGAAGSAVGTAADNILHGIFGGHTWLVILLVLVALGALIAWRLGWL